MPLYDFRCDRGHLFERMVRLVDFEEAQYCSCNAPSNRVISAPMISVENIGYDCPVTGKWIGSKREHLYNLDLHDCRVKETGEKEAHARARADREVQFDRTIEQSVEKQFEALPSAKKERLANELLGGVTATVERK